MKSGVSGPRGALEPRDTAQGATGADRRTTDVAERRSPLASQVALAVAFALLVAAGVVTVLVPELSDESDDERAPPQASERAGDASPATASDTSR
jgi:hypothetical protein